MYKIFPTEGGKWQIWYCPSQPIPSLDPRLPAAYPDKRLYGPTEYTTKDSAQTAMWRAKKRQRTPRQVGEQLLRKEQ